MNKILVGAISVLATTALTACGSSGGPGASSPGADTAKASIKAQILKQAGTTTGPFKMNDSQAGCTANAVVDALGTQKLQHYGLLTADNKITSKTLSGVTLSEADATAVVNSLITCIGDSTFTKALQTEIAASMPSTISAAAKNCLEKKLTLDALKPVLIGQLSGHPASASTFATSIEQCMMAH